MPVPPPGQVLPLDVLSTHTAWAKASKEIAYQELIQTVREFYACKQEEGQSAAKGNQRKGKANMRYAHVPTPPFAPKSNNLLTPKKDNPAKDAICHQCGEVGHWRRNFPIYLAELMKKKLSQGASTSGIFTIELYSFPSTSWVYDMGCAVKAIGEFHLCLPSGLVLILHNCHYAPSINRGSVLVSSLYKDGFVNRFENDNSIFVSRNNLIYFNAVPRDDIYEIVLSSSNTNDSSIVQKEVENQLGKTIKSLCFDREGEYMSQDFLDHLKEHGIITHRTPPYTPKYNGVLKRRDRTLLDMVRSMMSQTTLPKSFWDYALEFAARILNMVLTKKVDKTPYE
nr:retrotransposon protein, putative, Ty1-copia subclass [Tanacetum cinerariifolium]